MPSFAPNPNPLVLVKMGMKLKRLLALITGTVIAAADAGASRILVPQHEQGSVLLVDDRLIQPNVVIGGLPGVHALASDGKTAAVAAIKTPNKSGEGFDFKLAIIDVSTGLITGTMDIAGYVGHAAVSSDGRFAALTHPDRQSVSLVNLRKRKVIAAIEMDGLPSHLLFSRDGKQLLVSSQDSGQLSIISTASPTKMEVVDGLGAFGHLVLDPAGTRVYAANGRDGSVGIISIKRRTTITTLKVGGDIHGIDLSPDGSRLFAADFGNGAIIEIDIANGTRRSVPVAPEPYHVTALSDTRQLIVTSGYESLMWSISTPSLRIVANYRLEGVVDQIPEVEGTR